MKNMFFFLSICYLLFSCSKTNDFDDIVANKWRQSDESKDCIIDFAKEMDFEWDSMCFYSGALSLGDINKDLGFELKGFVDIGDRIVFLYKGKEVYHQDWFPNSGEPTEGVVFETEKDRFRLDKTNAKFKITKHNKAYYLTK